MCSGVRGEMEEYVQMILTSLTVSEIQDSEDAALKERAAALIGALIRAAPSLCADEVLEILPLLLALPFGGQPPVAAQLAKQVGLQEFSQIDLK